MKAVELAMATLEDPESTPKAKDLARAVIRDAVTRMTRQPLVVSLTVVNTPPYYKPIPLPVPPPFPNPMTPYCVNSQ